MTRAKTAAPTLHPDLRQVLPFAPLAVLMAVVMVASLVVTQPTTRSSLREERSGAMSSASARLKARTLSRLPLLFEANRGQASDNVGFIGRHGIAGDFRVAAGRAGVEVWSGSGLFLGVGFDDASTDSRMEGLDPQEAKTNYLLGRDRTKWHTGVPTYSKLAYRGLYPGIDAVVYGRGSDLEYDFNIAPGADPSLIAVSFSGVTGMRIAGDGTLVLSLPGGRELLQHKPVLYQDIGGRRRSVSGRYVLAGTNQVRFQIGSYDRTHQLVIDPVLAYSTYLGSTLTDAPPRVALGPDGSAYVSYKATAQDFGADGSRQVAGASDVAVAKLSPNGSRIVWITYIGGEEVDFGQSIAVNAQDQVYVFGGTGSLDFPTEKAFQPNLAADPRSAAERDAIAAVGCTACHSTMSDAFLFVLSESGSGLVFSSYLGGGQVEANSPTRAWPGGMAVDAEGNAIVVGSTRSTDFPTSPGAPQTSWSPAELVNDQRAPSTQGYVTKIDPIDATPSASFVWSTYLGGSLPDQVLAVTVDGHGSPYVTGATTSADFPTTTDAFTPDAPGGGDAFVTRFTPDGTLVFSTYLGGSGRETWSPAGAITFESSSGLAVVGGSTASTDFPLLREIQGQNNSKTSSPGHMNDFFIAGFDPLGRLVFSTYFGGSGDEGVADDLVGWKAMASDRIGGVYFASGTESADFPESDGLYSAPRSPSAPGTQTDTDAAVVKLQLTSDGVPSLVYSTTIRSEEDDEAAGLALAPNGDAWVSGVTGSAVFPTTPGAPRTATDPDTRSGFLSVLKDQCGSCLPVTDPPPVVHSLRPNGGAGAGGTVVRVGGRGFRPTSTVAFGDTPAANVTYLSDGSLEVVTPPNRLGDVLVTVSNQGKRGSGMTYSYSAGSWAKAGALALPRSHHSATPLDGPACRGSSSPGPGAARPSYCGKLLIAGGVTAGNLVLGEPSAELLDPITGTISPAAPMTVGRAFHTATLLDGPDCDVVLPVLSHCGKVLVVGAESPTAELYDPILDVWTPTAPMNIARIGHTATLLSGPNCHTVSVSMCGNVLVTGGIVHGTEIHVTPTASAEVFDPVTGLWSLTTPMKDPRAFHTSTLLTSGRVLTAGGLGVCPPSAGVSDSCAENNDTTISDHVGTVCSVSLPIPCDAGLVSTLINRPPLASAEMYDPSAMGWRSTNPLSVARAGGTATLLAATGEVLVVGGLLGIHLEEQGSRGQRVAQVMTNSVEVFDETGKSGNVLGIWAAGPLALEKRTGHSAVALLDGSVLIVGGGGYDAVSQTLPMFSTELYVPSTRGGSGQWRARDFMNFSHGASAANLISGSACREEMAPENCGKVMVVAGITDGVVNGLACDDQAVYAACPPGASFEIFTPPPAVTAVVGPDGLPRGPSSGGSMVVLAGSGLSGANSVRFGDVEATSFTVNGPTRVTAVAPAHRSGAVPVIVTTSLGMSSPDPGSLYTYEVSMAPGPVEDLRATERSDSEIELSWSAPASDGPFAPPASSYVVKQATAPITDDGSFDAATTLTLPQGNLIPAAVGVRLTLSISDLEPATTYYYALKAVNGKGMTGPMSNAVAVSTQGSGRDCPVRTPQGRQVSYPRGYSLVGLPGSTVLSTASGLYGWFNLGAGGSYSTLTRTEPMGAGRGYWAWFSCPAAVTVAGPGTSSVSLPLGAYRASMVGNPSATAPATVAGHDFAARWDPDANGGAGGYVVSGYREPQSLKVGEGSWVFSYRDTQVSLDAR